MSISASPFAEREIIYLEAFRPGDWSIKVYAILGPGRSIDAATLAKSKALTAEYLSTPPFGGHYNVGFLGLHLGRGADFVFCNVWADENELHHVWWVSETLKADDLRPAKRHHPPVCCYDLKLQWHERQAWIRHVLSDPQNADIDAYLADTQVAPDYVPGVVRL